MEEDRDWIGKMQKVASKVPTYLPDALLEEMEQEQARIDQYIANHDYEDDDYDDYDDLSLADLGILPDPNNDSEKKLVK